VVDRADAIAHQHGGGMDGAGREDDLDAAEVLRLAHHRGADADAAIASEPQGADLGLCQDGDVRPRPHRRVQVSCPASSGSKRFSPRAESRFASTESAEPPPTMISL
jgi:hypothetical protein